MNDAFKGTPGQWEAIVDSPRTRKARRMAMVNTKGGKQCIDCTGSGKNYAEDVANAKFIVRAVNSHDALLEALRKMLEHCPCSPKERFSGHRIDCPVPEAEAAIDKAEGR